MYVDNYDPRVSPMRVPYAKGTRVLYTHLRKSPLEDVYCDANGWTGLPIMNIKNGPAWTEMSKQECGKLTAQFSEVKNMSFVNLESLITQGMDQIIRSSEGFGVGPSVMDMKRIAALKCLLGGLECDMANCAWNFCRRDDLGIMGHGHEQCHRTLGPGYRR